MAKRISIITKNCDSNIDKLFFSNFTLVSGKSNVMISAPHTYNHIRDGKTKVKDKLTLTLVKILSEYTNAHVIYTNGPIDYDPNYNKNNEYQLELINYIKENDIKYLIDLHGTSLVKDAEIEIGTNNLSNINGDELLLQDITKIFVDRKFKKIRIDKRFKSSRNTICNIINNKTKIKCLQLEISKKYRNLNQIDYFKVLVNTLIDCIKYMERRDKMNEINYIEKYDEILDIKPSYGYKRELGEIKYNQVGLEIEMSVNFNRNSYSFIRKMLKKVKTLVGDNGYFVKDGTVLGDYSFEIVLDPLTVEEIENFYQSLQDIIEFSQGHLEISKEKNCGIHMNFNKKDILDINQAHKRATTFVKEHSNFFDQNIYKQFKFIWDYEKYSNYQNVVGDKYLWINYLKKKVVEIRNLNVEINASELAFVIKSLLQALYYDKEIEVSSKTFTNINKLYDMALENANDITETLDKNEFVIIGLKDCKGRIIKLSDELTEQIKSLL